MNSYCLKCKKSTKDINSKGYITKNERHLVRSICDVCKSENLNLFQNKMLQDFLVHYFQIFQY